MKQKVNSIKRQAWGISIVGIFGLIYCPWCFLHIINMSIWFAAVTDIFLLTALIYTYITHKNLNANELMEGNLIEVSDKMVKLKYQQTNWLKFSIPFIILWISWFIFENASANGNKYIIIGGCIGAVIGGAIGTASFRKTRRMLNEIIEQIDELKEEKDLN
jgi:hypothetical protein